MSLKQFNLQHSFLLPCMITVSNQATIYRYWNCFPWKYHKIEKKINRSRNSVFYLFNIFHHFKSDVLDGSSRGTIHFRREMVTVRKCLELLLLHSNSPVAPRGSESEVVPCCPSTPQTHCVRYSLPGRSDRNRQREQWKEKEVQEGEETKVIQELR